MFGWANALFSAYTACATLLTVVLFEYYSMPGAARWDIVGLVIFALCVLYSCLVATVIGFLPDRAIYMNGAMLEDLSRSRYVLAEALGLSALLEVLFGCLTKTSIPGATWVLDNLHDMPVLVAIIILTGIAARDFFFYPFNIEVSGGLVTWVPAQRTNAMSAPSRIARVLVLVVALAVALAPAEKSAAPGSFLLVGAAVALVVASSLISPVVQVFAM